MRAHFWQYITNEEGQPVSGVSISVYLTETYAVASVYTTETGGAVVSTAPQVTSDANGFFEFWIADSSDVNGYEPDQKFTIAWEKTGVITAGSIDNVEVYPRVEEVDETSTNTQKNKLVSNNQAKVWTAKPKIAGVLLEPGDWSGGPAVFTYTFNHSLGNQYPLIIVYNINAGANPQSVSSTIDAVNTNQAIISVTIGAGFDAYITAVG